MSKTWSGLKPVNTVSRLSHAKTRLPRRARVKCKQSRHLEEPLSTAKISRRPDVGECDVEPVGVLVSDRTQLIFAIFHANAAAVPVPGRLQGCVLNRIQSEIKPDVRCHTESPLRWRSVAEKYPDLVKVRDW